MGWTYTDLHRNRLTLEQAKADHVRDATRYGETITARIIMHEWHDRTWYAIIAFYASPDAATPTNVFLRTDKLDCSRSSFGYKDMCEQMGPHLDDKPSRALAKAVFKYIPEAPGEYARKFRDWAQISYRNPNTAPHPKQEVQ